MTAGTLLEQCTAMHAHKQQMMADTKTQDAALLEQVALMNNAADAKKLGMLAALVTRMAEQRVAMHTHMASMGDGMMRHMAQHMQLGKDSVLGCPMMKGMQATDDKTARPAQGQK